MNTSRFAVSLLVFAAAALSVPARDRSYGRADGAAIPEQPDFRAQEQ